MNENREESDVAVIAAFIVADMAEQRRLNFLRDTRDKDWEPPMWIRAMDHRLVDYHPENPWRGLPKLTWTPLGLAVRAHLQEANNG